MNRNSLFIGAINIGLRYLKSDGWSIAFSSTEPHGMRVKLLTPHRGLTPLTELEIIKNNWKYHEGGNADQREK
jgi:hypothetical protein